MAPRRHFKLPDSVFRQRFRRRLLGWYARNGRDLPWRHTRDPYHILVSEVMLQQTQVDRVLPKYKEWLERFPSFEALAAVSVKQATRLWYPLGYNVRPRRLHAIARTVVKKHAGKLPSDTDTLLTFKGLGKYTVGAVQSFAFGQRAAILDTNVARVLSACLYRRATSKVQQQTNTSGPCLNNSYLVSTFSISIKLLWTSGRWCALLGNPVATSVRCEKSV